MKISWASKKIKSGKSKIEGRGVFVVKPIKKAELVAAFGGYVVELQKLKGMQKSKPRTFNAIYSVGYQIEENLVLGVTNYSQFSTTEYINHSCEPTCGFGGQINIYALRDIDVGEEITIDYCMCISDPIFNMQCNCGSKNCRKNIFSNDWTIKALQKKYRGFFQPYILRKIGNIN